MAAAWDPVVQLCKVATCSVCREYFSDPVTIAECGHNFCRACLAQLWGGAGAEAPCPQCKEKVRRATVFANVQLASIVDVARQLRLQGGERKARLCASHQEPLRLFCRNDGAPICGVCNKSKEHEDHRIVPVEEAVSEYKEFFCSQVEIMGIYKAQIVKQKAATEKEIQDLLMHAKTQREKALADYGQLHRFLEEQEKCLLRNMAELHKAVPKERDEPCSPENSPSLED